LLAVDRIELEHCHVKLLPRAMPETVDINDRVCALRTGALVSELKT
jgi:hypothetical protein